MAMLLVLCMAMSCVMPTLASKGPSLLVACGCCSLSPRGRCLWLLRGRSLIPAWAGPVCWRARSRFLLPASALSLMLMHGFSLMPARDFSLIPAERTVHEAGAQLVAHAGSWIVTYASVFFYPDASGELGQGATAPL
ncbi:hypothetical protein GDO78_001275 [Eleutherodactylus coqui]|uniref:Uncharacterized protein n=1 Tax=Eleutherodactylus coqui TaxID=57060 RepID=A0A8J6FSE4_ELECQ|nr:hypothetical protein GDO78_001275 [Eleutherodactylus coqui]